MTGATPIIVDVDITSYNITPECIEEATENWNGDLPITALIVVHEFGCPVDMPAIVKVARKNKLTLIEDAACAMGATIQGQHVGTFGDFGCFSFHPRKTLTTGEGGAIVTSNPDFHERIKALRNHGITIQNSRVEFSEPALNFRLTDIQAAIGIAQLEKLASNLSKRRRLATLYKEALSGLSGIKVPTENPGHSWQTYMILINSADRESLITSLRQENIETNLGAQSLLKTKAYQHLSQTNSPTPNADLLYKQGLAIPFCEQYSLNEVSLVANAIERLLR
jgi:dTDP-4-amino-4,6-dideoxygalactose transaminase